MKKKATYYLVVSGLLIGLSIVLTRVFSINLIIAGVPASRLSVGYLPIMLASILLGPVWGMGVGALADVVGFLLFPSGTYFPPITLTSALVGMLPYVFMRLTGNWPQWLKVLISVALTQILCSIFLQTYWLSLLMGKAYLVLFFPRAVVTLVTIPVYYLLIHSVLGSLKKRSCFQPIHKR